MRILWALTLAVLLPGCGGDAATPAAPELGSLQGRWVVINYWAQWCKPCIEEIPELNALAQAYPEIAVLGVNFDGLGGEELRAQEQQLGVAFPTLAVDPAAALGVARPAVLPTTLVVGPDGVVRDILVGPQTLESLAEAAGLEKMDRK